MTGPENSGSRLCARIIAHVLGVCNFNKWTGHGWAPTNSDIPHKILHRSTPFGRPVKFLNIEDILSTFQDEKIKFVFTTRDKNITKRKYGYSPAQAALYIAKNKEIIKKIQSNKIPYILWSFETLVLYEELYLQELYDFIDVKSDFLPSIKNANKKYLK